MENFELKIGAAKVEYGDPASPTVFDITKGGIVFRVSSTKHDSTVDQFGDTIVESTLKGTAVQVTVPYAVHDLKRLSEVMPNGEYVEDATDPSKARLDVFGGSGVSLTANAKPLVIKPTNPNSTANDWITIPRAAATTNPEYTYNADGERITLITFVGYPSSNSLLYQMGDTTATASTTTV
jgi:hypothetical protein